MAKRKDVSTRTRFEIFKRDEFTCQYCGRRPPAVVLHLDHIVPVADGGSNDRVNLITSCEPCNLGKSDVPLSRMPPAQSEELARRTELAKQIEAMNRYLIKARKQLEESADRIGTYYCDQSFAQDEESQKGLWNVSKERMSSIKTFLKHLPESEILDAIDIAYSRHPVRNSRANDIQTWKYFCGVCWRKIKDDGRHEGGA